MGRYEFGSALESIEAYERYAIAVGWQNGTVTDDDYLASLQRAIDMAPEGTKEQLSAQNTYDDAAYTIGRNKLVRDVNNAPTDGARVTALQALVTYDEAKLETMVGGNEQKRELVDRIAGTKASVRDARWSQLVRRYNANQIGNQQMLDFARQAAIQAQGAPDQQQWSDRITEFGDRIATDHLQQLEQDYQYDRVSGGEVLAYIDQRLSGMAPGSPGYVDLQRRREDFAKSYRADESAQRYSLMYDQRQEGTITDNQWLTYLHERVQEAPVGSDERKAAKHDLVMETFNVAEARLYYNVAVNGAPVSDLISFYQTSLYGLAPGSGRARDIKQKINDLQLRGIDSINLGGSDPSTTTTPGHRAGGNNQNRAPGNRETMTPGRIAWEAQNPYHPAGDTPIGGPITVDDFLAALSNHEGNGNYQARNKTTGAYGKYQHLPQYWPGRAGKYLGDRNAPMSPENQEKVTRAMVMEKYERWGDWRLVALAWHNGHVSSTDPRDWNTRNKKYVTRIMRDLGGDMWTPVTTQGVYAPSPGWTPGSAGEPSNLPPRNPTSGRNNQPEAPGREPNVDPTPPTPDTPLTENQRRARGNALMVQAYTQAGANKGSTANLPGSINTIAADIVTRLGGNPQNEESVRAVAAWLIAENGQNIQGNNPLNLQTDGARDLPGQLNRTEDGYAIFGTWQDGSAAAAAEIADYYPGIARAIKVGNAEQVIRGIEQSNWRDDDYGGALVANYNSTGPTTKIIGGQRIYNTPSSLANLTRDVPGLADLFEVDPSDPEQIDWFEKNLTSLKQAFGRYDPAGQRAAGTWTFITPDGRSLQVAFDPSMYFDVKNARADYYKIVGNDEMEASTRASLHDEATGLSWETTEATLDSFERLSSNQLAAGDLSGAIQTRAAMLGFVRDTLGLPTDVPIDTAGYQGNDLDDSMLDTIQSKINKLNPRTDDNPEGDPILGLLDPNARVPGLGDQPPISKDPDTGLWQLHPQAGYFYQDGDGKVQIKTWRDSATDFALEDNRADLASGVTPASVPRWKNERVTVRVPGIEVPIVVTPTTTSIFASIVDNSYRPPGPTTTGAPSVDASGAPLAFTPNGYGTVAGLPVPPLPSNSGPAALVGRGIGAWLLGTTPDQLAPTSRAPIPPSFEGNSLVLPTRSSVDAYTIQIYDPNRKVWLFGYTLDDPKNPTNGATVDWIFTPRDTTKAGPTPVLNPGVAQITADGTLQLKNLQTGQWEDYKSGTPLSSYLHWYGTSAADQSKGSVGNVGQWMPTRTSVGGEIAVTLDNYEWVGLNTGVSPRTQRDTVDAARESRTFAGKAAMAGTPDPSEIYYGAVQGPVNPNSPRLSGSTSISLVRRMAIAANDAREDRTLAAVTQQAIVTPVVNAKTGFTMPAVTPPPALAPVVKPAATVKPASDLPTITDRADRADRMTGTTTQKPTTPALPKPKATQVTYTGSTKVNNLPDNF